jgi:hypothetical protein
MNGKKLQIRKAQYRRFKRYDFIDDRWFARRVMTLHSEQLL